MRPAGYLQPDAGPRSEAVSQCLQPNRNGPAGLIRLQPLESVAHIDRPPVLPYFTQADKEVGVRIVRPVHQLDDRITDHLQRFNERRAGERQHIVALLELPVVATAGDRGIDDPTADRPGCCAQR